MAYSTANGKTIGGIGPVVFRDYNGKNIVQTRPKKFKQTVQTVASGKEFGTASRLSKAIRHALSPITLGFNDNRMYTRLTSVLYQTIISNKSLPKGVRTLGDGNLSLIDHFQCNVGSPFPDYCAVTPELYIAGSRVLTLALPEFKISEALFAPVNTSAIALCFLVICINTENGNEIQSDFFKLDIPLRNTNDVITSHQWQTNALPENCLVLVSAAVIFYQSEKLLDKVNLNSKLLHPCEIVRVFKV